MKSTDWLRWNLGSYCKSLYSDVLNGTVLLLAVLSYNVGAGRLLGYGKHPKSLLLRKIEEDRAGRQKFLPWICLFLPIQRQSPQRIGQPTKCRVDPVLCVPWFYKIRLLRHFYAHKACFLALFFTSLCTPLPILIYSCVVFHKSLFLMGKWLCSCKIKGITRASWK